MKPLANYINRTFGQLKVTHCVESSNGANNGGKWLCMCKCRRMITLTGYQLHSRKSCGCLGKKHREQMGKNNRKSIEEKTITEQYREYKRYHILPLLTKEQWLYASNLVCKYCNSNTMNRNLVIGNDTICPKCYKMKGLLSDEKFIDQVKKIYENKKPV